MITLAIWNLGHRFIRLMRLVLVASAGCEKLMLSRQFPAAPAVAPGRRDKDLSRPADPTASFSAKRTRPTTNCYHYFVLFLVPANILEVLSYSNIYEYILEVIFILI
jgi:hypothetical protein